MKKLIVNTANDKLLVVLSCDNKVFYKINEGKSHHNESMFLLIDEILKENKIEINEIDEFGVVIGPGSFTGIRVGISTIKAFRDSLNVPAKGINNLDYLFMLAKEKNPDIETVALCGSKDSYFVAKLINGIVYKYERNLTLTELNKVSEGKPVAMFKQDNSVNCFVVEDDACVLLKCLNESVDLELKPVYYQLSQAENEKLKRGEVCVEVAKVEDYQKILQLETQNILINTLTEQDIETALSDKSYKTFIVKFNDDIVGFIITQITDEVNIVSVVVDKMFRNLGLATKLINEVEEFAKLNKLNISLEVAYNNITAYLLYTKLGFKTRRVRKKYYANGVDALEMVKELI